MACIRPQFPKEPNGSLDAQGKPQTEVQAARRGLLKAIFQSSVAPRFSSRPIDIEDYFSDAHGSFAADGNSAASPPTPSRDFRSSLVASKHLTPNEHTFLENLLQSDDLDSIRRASQRLTDIDIFPPASEGKAASPDKSLKRRDSALQRHLFRLHENTTAKSSGSSLQQQNMEENGSPSVSQNNSITQEDEPDTKGSWDMEDSVGDDMLGEAGSNLKVFGDVNSWIDGNQGVEVDGEGNPAIPSLTSNPFQILGTSADDVSCHPHVLSPPLMEGLQAFMPESIHEHHYWLKYSMVRDGPNLITMLRHCRASSHTILAIETTDGYVFGSFTSQPWRLVQNKDFYGSKDSFVWRMRRSRNEPCDSVAEKVLIESQIDVFPFTGMNNNVQRWSADGIELGEGELEEMSSEGTHYGHAIRISDTSGSTSTSETFGSPSLVHPEKRGEEFTVANIEMWALTPHTSIESAVTAEMNRLFLAESRNPEKNLNLLEILVSGPN